MEQEHFKPSPSSVLISLLGLSCNNVECVTSFPSLFLTSLTAILFSEQPYGGLIFLAALSPLIRAANRLPSIPSRQE
jgi:hypothetical protein